MPHFCLVAGWLGCWGVPSCACFVHRVVSCAELCRVVDERGRKDLFGNIMRVTQRALADNLVSAAQVLMGETNESTPIVIIHFNGSAKEKIHFTKRKIHTSDLSVKDDDCVYIKGFSNPIQFY